jgi:purine-nucleoside phosphorylase
MSHQAELDTAIAAIRSRCKLQPRAGIVLGSGLGAVGDAIESAAVIPYEMIPGFAESTVPGHRGELVLGHLAGKPVVAMRGRFHKYEGYSSEQLTFPARLLCRMGIEMLAVSNAAGGLNPRFSAGDVMLIESHIDLLFNKRNQLDVLKPAGRADRTITQPYDPALIEIGLSIARQHGFPLHQGVYISLSGPTYETRSEYRMLRKMGGDAVGMSTVPEVLIAVEQRVRVVGLSTITNVADPDAPKATSHADVVATANTAQEKLSKIVLGLIESLD